MVGCDADNKVSLMGWGLCPIENSDEYIKHLAVMLKMSSDESNESLKE